MPYGFNEDRSKYQIQEGGGGGLSPMFVHMAGTSIAESHLDKTAREIYEHASQGGLVIWLGDGSTISIFTEMQEYNGPDVESTVYRVCFGNSGIFLEAATLDDYPRIAVS